jgi:hypothetical protein
MRMSEEDFERALRTHGFKQVRGKKHRVFKDADGKTLVTASTPSDWRSSRNEWRDLARALGKPIEIVDHRPLRARRPHGKLPVEDESVHPLGGLEPASPPPTVQPVLSRADRMRLKRWEKHEAQHKAKIEAQRTQLRKVADVAHRIFLEGESSQDEMQSVTAIVWNRCEELGFKNCALAIAEDFVEEREMVGIYLRVGTWYIDFFDGALREMPTWTESNGRVRVEVWGHLQPYEWEIPGFEGEIYTGWRDVIP